MGIHYFSDATTATFDLNTADDAAGITRQAKKASQPAPGSAPKGQNGQGFGSVAWLQLSRKRPAILRSSKSIGSNTAGGNPPPICDEHSRYV